MILYIESNHYLTQVFVFIKHKHSSNILDPNNFNNTIYKTTDKQIFPNNKRYKLVTSFNI